MRRALDPVPYACVPYLQASLNFQDPELTALIESLPEAPAAARLECLKMCGLEEAVDDPSSDSDENEY